MILLFTNTQIVHHLPRYSKYVIYIKKLHFWYCPLTSGPPGIWNVGKRESEEEKMRYSGDRERQKERMRRKR